MNADTLARLLSKYSREGSDELSPVYMREFLKQLDPHYWSDDKINILLASSEGALSIDRFVDWLYSDPSSDSETTLTSARTVAQLVDVRDDTLDLSRQKVQRMFATALNSGVLSRVVASVNAEEQAKRSTPATTSAISMAVARDEMVRANSKQAAETSALAAPAASVAEALGEQVDGPDVKWHALSACKSGSLTKVSSRKSLSLASALASRNNSVDHIEVGNEVEEEQAAYLSLPMSPVAGARNGAVVDSRVKVQNLLATACRTGALANAVEVAVAELEQAETTVPSESMASVANEREETVDELRTKVWMLLKEARKSGLIASALLTALHPQMQAGEKVCAVK